MSLLFALVAAVCLPRFADAQCHFPSAFQGVWKGNFWTNLTINSTHFGPLFLDKRNFSYECFLNEGSTYALRSRAFNFAGNSVRYYLCLNLTSPPDNSDVIYYYIGTEENADHSNDPVYAQGEINTPPNMTTICNKATVAHEEYDILLKDGWENRLPVGSCAPHLQAAFTANFTNVMAQNENCTDFIVDGCQDNQRQLIFNYTDCGLGVNSFKCVFNLASGDNTTYTTLYMEPVQGETNPYAPYSCLEQMYVNGATMITHTAGTCRGILAEHMVLTETERCRVTVTTTTTSPANSTTSAGRNATTAATTTANGGNGGQGGGGNGDVNDGGNAANGMLADAFSLVTVMFFAKMALP